MCVRLNCKQPHYLLFSYYLASGLDFIISCILTGCDVEDFLDRQLRYDFRTTTMAMMAMATPKRIVAATTPTIIPMILPVEMPMHT